MPLDYKTLPAQWKKAKPITMGKTGVGELLQKLVSYDKSKVTTPAAAETWATLFQPIIAGLDAAGDKKPISGDAKTKKWVADTLKSIMFDANWMAQAHDGILVYDENQWILATIAQEKIARRLKAVTAAWPNLKPATRNKIMALVKGG